MARTKSYPKTHSSKKVMSHRVGKPYHAPTQSHTSSSASSSSSSSHHQSPQPHPQPSTPDSAQLARGRRGRQARPSRLTPNMHRAVRRFARHVGAPNVVEPAGFRDFRGWLARLGARESRPIWDQLIATVARDVDCDMGAIKGLTEDIVREIVKCVVVPRPDESAKLVSTNAGRQASRPRSGTTLMVVLEQQLSRLEYRLPQLVEEVPPPSPGSDDRSGDGMLSLSDGFYGHEYQRGSLSASQRHRSSLGQSADKLPSVSDILGDRRGSSSRQSLPSFKELDASIRKNGSGSGSR